MDASIATTRRTTPVLRPWHGPEDLAILAAVNNANRTASGSLGIFSEEMFRNAYAHLVNCDLATDLRIAMDGDRPVAYVRVEWHDELRGERVHQVIPFVDPAAPAGTFDRLLDWGEARQREIAAGLPDRPPRRVMRCMTLGHDDPVDRVLRERGYAPARYFFEMRRPTLDEIPAGELPPGVDVRPVEPAHLRAIWEAEIEAFLGHWGASEEDASETRWDEWQGDPLNDLALWQVAWQGDEIVGMVRPFINGVEIDRLGVRRGWCENISVRAPWRGRGVASALIGRALRALRERGMTESALSVDADNETGALALYRRMGFAEVARESHWRRPLESEPGQ